MTTFGLLSFTPLRMLISASSSPGDTQTRLFRIPFILVHLFLCIYASMQLVEAGLCWSTPNSNGRCTDLIRTHVTEDECCNGINIANYGIATASYSPDDLKSGQLFFYRALGGGVPCTLCKVTCEGVNCGSDRRCVVKSQGPTCICSPKCSRRKRRIGPVCGSDGRTYRHMCRLVKRKCRKDGTLSIAYYGPCQETCEKIKCRGSKTCITDQNLKPHCVRCKRYCPPVKPDTRLVCGSDNVTYASICHLQMSSCLSGKSIPVAYRGDCQNKYNFYSLSNGNGLTALSHDGNLSMHFGVNNQLMHR